MAAISRSLNILVIEDVAILSMDLEWMLEDLGHAVIAAASNPNAALSALERERRRIDAAIVDANLGGKTSLPIVEKLRECGIPCVLVSGYAAEQLRAMGFTEPTLQKPYDQHAIGAALDRL